MKEVIYNFLIKLSKVILFFKRLAVKRRMMKVMFWSYTYHSNAVTFDDPLFVECFKEYLQLDRSHKYIYKNIHKDN